VQNRLPTEAFRHETTILTAPNQPRLDIRNVSKSFGGIRALRDVSFIVKPGEVHALIGENGAGKSTLVKIVTGLEQPDTGEILLDGAPCRFCSPMEARRSGVVAVYQEPKVFPHLDVAENIFIGLHPTNSLGLIDRARMFHEANKLLAALGSDLDPTTLVAGLSVAESQFVEFARALAHQADKVLILDEPTASLTGNETEKLFRVVRNMRERGVAVIIISHRLEDLRDLVDTVTILRDGRHVATKAAASLSEPEIIKLMVGRSQDELYGTVETSARTGGAPRASERLRVKGLTLDNEFADVSFSLRAGEIVGMFGLVGAGRTEIARSLFGITPPDGGSVAIDGREVDVRDPRQMLARGLAYLPEDREGQGLVPTMSVRKNVVVTILDKLAQHGILRLQRERAFTLQTIAELGIKTEGSEAIVSSLSGGNRQKVVLGKWLAIDPKILILDEPTHGIDIGSKAQVHQLVVSLAARGIAILLISSDLPEILRLSDRVLVVANGRITATLDRPEMTEEKILLAASRETVESCSRHPSTTTINPAAGTPRDRLLHSLLHGRILGVIAFLLLLSTVFSLAAKNFGTVSNANTIALNGSILVVVACAEAIVVITRNYDISVGAIVALSSYVGLDFIRLFPGFGPILIAVPVLIGGFCGVLNGFLVAYCRLPSVIVTLATLSVYRGLAFLYANGHQIDPKDLPLWVANSVNGHVFGISVLVILGISIAVLAALGLRYLKIGRQIYAIGSNPDAAIFYGLKTERLTWQAYVICGLLTGLAGFLFGARVSYVVPYLAQGLELTALAAVVLGGISVLGGSGNVFGAAIGALTIATIENGLVLLGASEFLREFVYGTTIVAAVIVDAVIQRRIADLLKRHRRVAVSGDIRADKEKA
jgi:rhamnose transport system ATP-binding protein